MAAVPRDPAFWKRFSTAVHASNNTPRNPSAQPQPSSSSSSASTSTAHYTTSKMSEQSDWLTRQNAKRNRRTVLCYVFWIGFAVTVGVVVAFVAWVVNSGALDGGSSGGKGKGE